MTDTQTATISDVANTTQTVIVKTANRLTHLINDPLNPDLRQLETLLPFSEAAKLLPGNANVRQPRVASKPYRDMIHTATENPTSFHLLNRGITYVCDRFMLNRRESDATVQVVTAADHKEGIADGGHTFAALSAVVAKLPELQEIPDWTEPYVRVRFVAGHVAGDRIVEALNTSTQVQPYTIHEYRNEFEPLKAMLANAGIDVNLVAWRENQAAPWNVREVLQRLACFLPGQDSDIGPGLYKSRARALDMYLDNQAAFESLRDVVRDLMFLPEFIESQFSLGNVLGARARFGGLRVVRQLAKEHEYPGTGFKTLHTLEIAAVLPLAGAFRELLEWVPDAAGVPRARWIANYKEVFTAAAEDLYRCLVKSNADAGSSTKLGSSQAYWAAAANVILRAKAALDTPKARAAGGGR